MYSLADYCSMIEDGVRTRAYLAALERVITPDSVVVEIGTGTGFFAVIAARLGARKVYAIEPDSAVRVAREVAAENGVADRIEFIEAMSTEVQLPEPADVLLSDLRGVLPVHQAHIPSIVDARTRLLKPGGVQIPTADRVFMALVESEEHAHTHLRNADPAPYGVDLAPVHRLLAHIWAKRKITPEQLLSGPVEWAHLDYHTVTDPALLGSAELVAIRDGVAHGLAAWFEAELLPGIGFSNAPGADDAIYGQAFFPFPQPLRLRAGETVRASLQGRLSGGEYAWRWKASSQAGGEAWGCDQSTFFHTPLSPEFLRRRAPDYAPGAGRGGQLDAWIISHMDATRSLADIAGEAAQLFPDVATSYTAALERVRDMSERYSR
jgi:protein arginine N-methyltransferase 1